MEVILIPLVHGKVNGLSTAYSKELELHLPCVFHPVGEPSYRGSLSQLMQKQEHLRHEVKISNFKHACSH